MRTIPAGQFKARCLKIMDEVHATREPVIITKKGRPVARLVADGASAKDIFGCMKGQVEIVGDVVAPAIPIEDWSMIR